MQEANQNQAQVVAQKVRIYVSFAPADEKLLSALMTQFAILWRRSDLQFWDKRKIVPGTNRQKEIDDHIDQSQLFLILLSANYLASDECYQEMERIAARQKEQAPIHIVPILMGYASGWRSTPLGKLEPLPTDKKPVNGRADRDEILDTIFASIEQIIDQIQQKTPEKQQVVVPVVVQANVATPGSRPMNNQKKNVKKILQEKREAQQFDVFLCHHGVDKPDVKEVGEQLMLQGILPWLDEWELQPGKPWIPALEEQIENVKSAAVFVGEDGMGPWQSMEINALLNEFVNRGCPVIPVLLSSAPKKPDLPLFLKAMTWVDFRTNDPNTLKRLIWGITGIRPEW